ncbi:MAG TPA: O-antigen ligase family protein [Acidothermaceae bacterium]
MSAQQAVERPWHVDLDRAPRTGHLDQTVVLMVLTWLAVVLPRFVQSLTAPKHEALINDAIPYSSSTSFLSHLLTLLVIGWSVLVVARGAANLPTDRRRVLVILLAPWIYLVTRDLYSGVHLHLQDLEYPAIVIAVWVLRPPIRKLALLGYLAAALALISVLMGVFLKSKGLYHASNGDLVPLGKKILPWGILVGPLTSENNLGQVLVLGLPLIGLARSRIVRLLVVALTTYAVVWTASRSSIAALAVGGLIALALQVPGRKLRQVVAAVLVLAAGLVMIALPVSTSDGTAFSNRGYIWIASLRAWSQHRLFGLGSQWFSSLAKYEEGLGGQAFHGHNTFVQMVVMGGAVLLVLVAAMAVVSLGSAVRWVGRGVNAPAVLLGTFFVSATLEWSFAFYDRDFLLAVTVLPMAMVLFAERPRDDEPASGADDQTQQLDASHP